jgi:Predicted nucleic acid-binding protein, contains PIN domain
MARVFFDTSAYAKLYIAEKGSRAAAVIARDAETVVVSAIVMPETVSALRRLVREDRLDEAEYDMVKARLCNDLASLECVAVDEETIVGAIATMEHSALVRTLDALHIGAAMAAKAELFVTSDLRQAEAARASGLRVRVV